MLARGAALDPADWSAAFGLGTALCQPGRVDQALTWWKAARELDPLNFTVRKQIWRVEHPERFYTTIDTDWQQEQLDVEGYVRPGEINMVYLRRPSSCLTSGVSLNTRHWITLSWAMCAVEIAGPFSTSTEQVE